MSDLVIMSKSEIEAKLGYLIFEFTGFNVNIREDAETVNGIKRLINHILDKATPVSEPVGDLRCDASTGHTYGVYWYKNVPAIGTKVYTTPQQAIPECYSLVSKEDANNYCKIISLLGMEEEGDVVEEVKRLSKLQPATLWKDHNTRELVNKLTDVAKAYGQTQQLRDRISSAIQDYVAQAMKGQ